MYAKKLIVILLPSLLILSACKSENSSNSSNTRTNVTTSDPSIERVASEFPIAPSPQTKPLPTNKTKKDLASLECLKTNKSTLSSKRTFQKTNNKENVTDIEINESFEFCLNENVVALSLNVNSNYELKIENLLAFAQLINPQKRRYKLSKRSKAVNFPSSIDLTPKFDQDHPRARPKTPGPDSCTHSHWDPESCHYFDEMVEESLQAVGGKIIQLKAESMTAVIQTDEGKHIEAPVAHLVRTGDQQCFAASDYMGNDLGKKCTGDQYFDISRRGYIAERKILGFLNPWYAVVKHLEKDKPSFSIKVLTNLPSETERCLKLVNQGLMKNICPGDDIAILHRNGPFQEDAFGPVRFTFQHGIFYYDVQKGYYDNIIKVLLPDSKVDKPFFNVWDGRYFRIDKRDFDRIDRVQLSSSNISYSLERIANKSAHEHRDALSSIRRQGDYSASLIGHTRSGLPVLRFEDGEHFIVEMEDLADLVELEK